MSDLGSPSRLEIDGYQVLRLLATGGTSRVYLAIQKSLNRKVAIKLLDQDDKGHDQQVRWRFSESASQVAAVAHPNVVRIIDMGIVGESPYVVQELVEGGDLRTYIERLECPIDRGTVAKFVRQMGAGLTELHENGIVHGDLKPENVLVTTDGKLMITDVGTLLSDSDDNRFIGTEGYASPEQKYRIGFDAQSDQYALAVIAAELLTGRLHSNTTLNSNELQRLIGKQSHSVLKRGMEEDPEQRYSSITEFVDQLERALQVPLTKNNPSMPSTLVATMVVACVVICIASVGFVSWHYYGSKTGNANLESSDNEAASLAGSPKSRVEQTGALCFRVIDGQLEFLLVRNRTDTHWTIPKENQSKNATIEETIEEEAFEEAGASGQAFLNSVGDYGYSRNGNDYTVAVYPIRIDQMQDEWPEDFRGRKWFSHQSAVATIRSTGLREILRRFKTPES